MVRSWDWIIPGTLLGFLTPLVFWLRDSDLAQAPYCMGAVGLVMFVLALQTWKSYRGYWEQVYVDQLRAKREALAISAESQWASSFQAMHPETARLVLNYQKTVWLIDECDVNDLCEWRLGSDRRINARFVVYVLENSNDFSIMPQHGMLGDKTFSWDRLTSDRLMFQAFCDVLVRRNILTQAHGNQPGLWIEPWNPMRVAKRFGVEHLMDLDEDNAVDAGQPVEN